MNSTKVLAVGMGSVVFDRKEVLAMSDNLTLRNQSETIGNICDHYRIPLGTPKDFLEEYGKSKRRGCFEDIGVPKIAKSKSLLLDPVFTTPSSH